MHVYLDRERYNALVHTLLNVQPSAFSGEVGEDEIKIALGEGGKVWPESIEGDAEK